jgi:hypothetical protein
MADDVGFGLSLISVTVGDAWGRAVMVANELANRRLQPLGHVSAARKYLYLRGLKVNSGLGRFGIRD